MEKKGISYDEKFKLLSFFVMLIFCVFHFFFVPPYIGDVKWNRVQQEWLTFGHPAVTQSRRK